MNDERIEVVQQEIAPNSFAASSGGTVPQPVESNPSQAAAFLCPCANCQYKNAPRGPAAFLKRLALFLVFGNRVQLKSRSYYIAYMAILTALAIAVKPLSYDIGSFKLTFTYIPCFIAGIYFGPLFAAVLGAAVSYSQFLFLGYMPWTLNVVGQALIGVIMSIFVQGIRSKTLITDVKIILGAIAVCFIVTLGVNTVAFMVEPYSPNYGWTYWQVLFFTLPPRAAFQPLVVAINTFLTIYIVKALDKALFKNKTAVKIY